MSRSYRKNPEKFNKGSWNSKWKSQENDRIKELGDEEMEEFMQTHVSKKEKKEWKKR